MAADEEIQEWVKVITTAAGVTTIGVSLVQGNLSAKYAAKSYIDSIKKDVKSARLNAHRHLNALRDALAELDQEAADAKEMAS